MIVQSLYRFNKNETNVLCRLKSPQFKRDIQRVFPFYEVYSVTLKITERISRRANGIYSVLPRGVASRL